MTSWCAALFGGLLLSCGLAGCGAAGGEQAASGTRGVRELRVERGSLVPRLLLTGALQADTGYEVRVPPQSGGSQQIRWLIADGTAVEAGDLLLELDTTSFTSQLEDKRLSLVEKEGEIERRDAELAAAEADLAFALEEARIEREKQRLRSGVPEGLLSRRETEDRALGLARAEKSFEKAAAQLASQRVASRAELAQLELDRQRLAEEIRVAEEAVEALRFVAPHSGVAVVGEHPWEGRKLQEGDSVWMGMTVLRLPELAAMVIEARLSDVDRGKLAPGDPVQLTLDAYPDEPLTGQVAEVAPIAREERGDSLRRFFRVRIVPDDVRPERMRPGMSVKVESLPGRAAASRDLLLVPRASLVFAPGDSGVAGVRTPAGEWIEVSVGRCDNRACEVLSGLELGQRVAAVSGFVPPWTSVAEELGARGGR